MKEKYNVWYDLLLEDFFSIKVSEMTISFEKQLMREKAKFHRVDANSHIEAINQVFPKENRLKKEKIIH